MMMNSDAGLEESVRRLQQAETRLNAEIAQHHNDLALLREELKELTRGCSPVPCYKIHNVISDIEDKMSLVGRSWRSST